MKELHRDCIARVVYQLESISSELTEIKGDMQDEIPVKPETMEARRKAWVEAISILDAALESLGDSVDLLEPLGYLGGGKD